MLRWFKKSFGTATDSIKDRDERWEHLETVLGFRVGKHKPIFERALRHRSIVDNEQYESHETYERLEFLGDAVLDLIVTEIIFDLYPSKDEGFLTKLRAKLVQGNTLSRYALALELNKVLEVGLRAQGQGIELSKSVLSDIFESLVAVIYVTKGYEAAYSFVRTIILQEVDFEDIVSFIDNYKSLLLELSQANKLALPRYRVLSEEGPGHNKTFHIAVSINGEDYGRGKGKSKKQAEQVAAEAAFEKLSEEYT